MKNELYHYGIPGMRWGIRRFQNSDGSLTRAGMDRYGVKGYARDQATAFRNFRERNRAIQRNYDRSEAEIEKRYGKGQKLSPNDLARQKSITDRANSSWSKSKERYASDRKAANSKLKSSMKSDLNSVREKMRSPEFKANAKKVAIIGGAVAATALAAYGGYRLAQELKGRAYDKAYNKAYKAAKDWFTKTMDTGMMGQPISRVHAYRNEIERVAKEMGKEASSKLGRSVSTLRGYDPVAGGIMKKYNPENINIWAEAVKYMDGEKVASYLRDFL